MLTGRQAHHGVPWLGEQATAHDCFSAASDKDSQEHSTLLDSKCREQDVPDEIFGERSNLRSSEASVKKKGLDSMFLTSLSTIQGRTTEKKRPHRMRKARR